MKAKTDLIGEMRSEINNREVPFRVYKLIFYTLFSLISMNTIKREEVAKQ